jgi:hypothetical protein
MWRNLAKAFREMRRSVAKGGASYRPDLHYMRGPGPKWHAKYGHLTPRSALIETSAKTAPESSGRLDIAERHA